MKSVLPVEGYRSATDFMAAMQGTQGDTYWLLKPGEYWHGGIHLYENFAGNAVCKPESHGLKCMTDGQVVAWRLNDDYQTARYGTTALKFSSTFALVKSTCIPDTDKPGNALEFYTLWMQIAPLSEYGAQTPTATVTASSLKVRQDNPAEGWVRAGLPDGNVADAGRNYEAPPDTQTTLPRGSVVEIEAEATFLLNDQPSPFMFVRVKSVPDGKGSGLAAGGCGWISGRDKYVRREASNLPGWMQKAREQGVFNQVVSGESIEVKAGEVIGHLSYHERPEVGSQYFCHLEVFSQDPRMGDFLANKAGVTSGAAELHTLAGKILWKYNEDRAAFEVAGVGGVSLFSKAERLTPESECQRKESNGKTWYQIPAESAWMSAVDVEKVNQFDLEKRGFIRLEQSEEPRSFFQTAKEGWLRQAFGRLEKLTRSDASDTYSSGEAESYKKLLQQMDMNQDGLIETNELWRYLHNHQPDIQHQVQRLVVKHHSEWLKDGMSALWQAALDEQRKSYPELALYNQEYINKLVWMKEVPEIRSNEALWHMHPVVFLDALNFVNTQCYCYKQGIVDSPCQSGRQDVTKDNFEVLSDQLGIEREVLRAIAVAETGDKIPFKQYVSGVKHATILYERHFMKRLSLVQGVSPETVHDIESTEPNIIHSYDSSYRHGLDSEQYERLLRAREINYDAANMSSSWGKFQVMGEYYHHLYESTKELVDSQNYCALQHLQYFKVFLVEEKRMLQSMRDKDWLSIARKYNGTGQIGYDEKIKNAYDSLKNEW